ncbi:polyadenylate-binding protein 1-B-binding protein [Parasponia andersonii]|uniref:Polyadenylate-binding protein 1-B-binding protein n=1 Tax=Parasponia andersonii TaxID=3476 RepID=A0A2P5A7C3_PARAD|nr:polyadenylate-binding protein 1-B-binding protein [Parasponia andersonii]
MDREQHELQFLGFCGILKESYKIVLQWRKIFSQITLALILPLSFVFLAHFQISQVLFFRILNKEDKLRYTDIHTRDYSRLKHSISSQWAAFWLFKAAYFTLSLVLLLLSTAAVVYTIAAAYAAKPISFKKVMSVVPRVWKRLMVTFIWSFAIVLVYNVLAIGLMVLWIVLLGFSPVGIVFVIVCLIAYLVGFVYIGIIWHLASVVSVLEEIYGIKALKKSRNLIKGKTGVAVGCFVVFGVAFAGIELLFENFVVFGWAGGLAVRIGVGILCFLLLFKVILFGLVVQTVIYFVCKSYHHENIDKPSLSEHLEGYFGHYVQLKSSRDVQLEEVHV